MNTDDTIDVMDIDSYPNHLIDYLSQFSNKFEHHVSIEDKDFSFDFGAQALDLIKDYNIVAYHYTKEIQAGYFKANGLQCLSFDDHKKNIIETVKNKLSPSAINQLQSLQCPNNVDNGRLYFVYSFDSADAGDLARYFGGECIYGQITDGFCRNEISDVLETTGTPVAVKFHTGINTIKYCSAIDTIVSIYANKKVNKSFSVAYRQGFTTEPIMPEQILSVQEL